MFVVIDHVKITLYFWMNMTIFRNIKCDPPAAPIWLFLL